MAVEIMWDSEQQTACMWDTTTDTAFGPVFSGPSANVEIGEFMDWLAKNPPRWTVAAAMEDTDGTDVRHYIPSELARLVTFWCELPSVERST